MHNDECIMSTSMHNDECIIIWQLYVLFVPSLQTSPPLEGPGEVCLLGRSVYKKQLLMKRDNQLLSRRNRLICEMFFSLLREGMPAMRAYAATGNAFFLSEAQVRRIVSANA